LTCFVDLFYNLR